ncbi:MAG: sigma-70 family RNA polymerase sigma factor [Phycisphaerales bacterium]|nr:sigma-70 family RNA polymerase sigma factor [Phycisphaerales bacterium]
MKYDLSVTTSALLEGLCNSGDEAAWRGLDERYRPILIASGRRLGLSEADAVDVAQETMLRVLEGCRDGAYDRSKGRLRSWILTIARHRIIDLHRRRDVRKEAAGVSAVVELPDEGSIETCWSAEERAAILREALDALRSDSNLATDTIEAFELQVLHNRGAHQVAEHLGCTVNDVYLAKSRVTRRLKAMVETIETAWNDD